MKKYEKLNLHLKAFWRNSKNQYIARKIREKETKNSSRYIYIEKMKWSEKIMKDLTGRRKKKCFTTQHRGFKGTPLNLYSKVNRILLSSSDEIIVDHHSRWPVARIQGWQLNQNKYFENTLSTCVQMRHFALDFYIFILFQYNTLNVPKYIGI